MPGEPSGEPALAYTWGNSTTLRLEAGDLPRLVAAYIAGELRDGDRRRIGGSPLAAVGFHLWVLDPQKAPWPWRAKYEAIARELAGDIDAVKALGIEVTPLSGLLTWEIALFPFHSIPSPGGILAPLDAPVEALDSEGGQNAPPPDEGASRPRGRPRVVAPVERVRALAEEGLGAKAISRRLQGEGVEVSPRTVARWLQGELGL